MSEQVDSAARISQLSERKRALLQKWKMGESAHTNESRSITRRPDQSVVPLSFGQQRLWFLDQLHPGIAAYNVSFFVKLTGSFNIKVLSASLNEIAARHEVLRAIFFLENGVVTQRIASTFSWPLSLINLQGLSKAEQEVEVPRLATAEAGVPFDLTQGPLVRAKLVQLNADEYVMSLVMHHIISDGWSLGICLQELMTIYTAFLSGEPCPLPELPLQYADFAAWQRQSVQEKALKEQIVYWKKQLAGVPTSLLLPTDHPRPAVQTFRGSHYLFTFSTSLAEQLKAFSHRSNCSLFMTLLAAFQTLLARNSNQSDIVVGIPVANRQSVEEEKMLGFFANTQVIRAICTDNPPFHTFLSRVRQIVLEAFAHQALPFEELVNLLSLERDMSRNPLFQAMFSLDEMNLPAFAPAGMSLQPISIYGDTAVVDLWFSMWEDEVGLGGCVEYNSDLFDLATIQRMVDHFERLLTDILRNPEENIFDLHMVSEAEQYLKTTLNATQENRADGLSLPRCYEEVVATKSDVVAVSCENRQLTYQELNRQANKVAHYLQMLGVGPEVKVGICVERSLDMLILLLGIHKAGGAYVPLDPTLPRERLAFMLTDAQLPIVVTQQHLVAQFPQCETQLVCLESAWETIAKQSNVNPPTWISPENLAYVLYTSGSTGKPKGVQITHRSLINLLLSMKEQPGLTCSDTLLAVTTLSFDIAGLELFLPLVTGARLELVKREIASYPEQLAQVLALSAATVMQATPVTWQLLLDEPWLVNGRLKVLCGGEALSQELAGQLLDQNVDLWNVYGPTETTIWSLLQHITNANARISIGRPLANTSVYLLDDRLHMVPVGVQGYVCIGGSGLARGYLDRANLTAEKFIPNPFSNEAGARLYNTGDLARYLADGTIEFLGRADQQIKLRGFRIELGEVETALRSSPDIREAVVVAQEGETATKQLVAYVVPQISETHSEDVCQGFSLDIPIRQMDIWQESYDQKTGMSLINQDSKWLAQPLATKYSDEEMLELLENIVERILDLGINRVLEIGSGMGSLLCQIAPFCSLYHAIDSSQERLEYIQQKLTLQEQIPQQVTLQHQSKFQYADRDAETFDTIILNGVLQSCANGEHVLHVLRGILNKLAPGGTIFIGNVRNLMLQEAFHTAAILGENPGASTRQQLKEQVEVALAQEQELIFDPAFFFALKDHFSQITQVEVKLKRGLYRNEYTRFYYDVVLSTAVQPQAQPITWLDWHEQQLSLPAIRTLLNERGPSLLGIKGIANARLSALGQSDVEKHSQTFAEINALRAKAGIDPEDIWALSDVEDFHYTIDLYWSGGEGDGCYDALFRNLKIDPQKEGPVIYPYAEKEVNTNLLQNSYTNTPIRSQVKSELTSILRNHLKQYLPAYMVPSAFVVVDALPISPAGKIDRRALSRSQSGQSSKHFLTKEIIAPRTEVERLLVTIWMNALNLQQVSIHDNFFELGGDSILSIKIVSRAKQMGLYFAPQQMFQYQTIAELASVLSAIREQKQAEQYAPLSVTRSEEIRPVFSPFPLISLDQQVLNRLLAQHQEVEDIYPLTPLQEHMLFQRRYNPNPSLYWLCSTTYMRATQINMSAYEQAWQQVVAQHATLRTCFVWENLERPLQIVFKKVNLAIEHYDLRGSSSEEQTAHVDAYAQALLKRGSNLTLAPHLHIAFFRVSEHDYYQVRGLNNMLFDGWSSSLLDRDFQAFYEAICRGETLCLQSPPPFREYVAWLQQQDLLKAERFWRSALRDFRPSTPVLDRLQDTSSVAQEGFFKEGHSLSSALTVALQKMAKQYQVTQSTLFHAAWALLLRYYSQEDAVCFGSASSGRPAAIPDAEYTAGFFNNILPVWVRIPGEISLNEWLKNFQSQMAEMREYEYSPMLEIKKWMGLPPLPPLCESYIVYENFPRYSYQFAGQKTQKDLGLQLMDYHRIFSPMEYPIRVEFWPTRPSIIMLSCYRRYLDKAQLQTILRQVVMILESLVYNPEQSVGSLLTALDQETLKSFNV